MHPTAAHTSTAPRQFLQSPAAAPLLPGPGMPMERHARIAARRTFVDLKRQFIAAVAELGGPRGDWLRWQVRQAQEPVDLWLLRGAVFAGLGALGLPAERTRNELERTLDAVFPNGGEMGPYLPMLR